MTWQLVVHIMGGALGLLSGTAAIIAAKGSRPHRIAGRVFFASMLVMAVLGGHIAALADVRISVLAAVVTAYLVSSGTLIARRADGAASSVEWLLFATGIAITSYGVHLGLDARSGHADVLNGGFRVPPAVYFVFAGMAGIGAMSDAWMLARGGLQRRAQILQHVWRMSAALHLAMSSFFNGQQDLFPEPLRGSFLLSAPPLLIVALLVFWLARVTLSKRYRESRQRTRRVRDTAV